MTFASWVNSISLKVYFGLFFWSVSQSDLIFPAKYLFLNWRLRVFLIHLIPCLLLIIFNGLLLAGVFQAEKKRSNLVVSRARRRGR